jgi:hypothetical protein
MNGDNTAMSWMRSDMSKELLLANIVPKEAFLRLHNWVIRVRLSDAKWRQRPKCNGDFLAAVLPPDYAKLLAQNQK